MTNRPSTGPDREVADDEESDVKKLDTTPPPPGEDDAYNAPTKVGEVTSEAWAKLIEEHKEDPPAKSSEKPKAKLPTPTPPPVKTSASPPRPDEPDEIPRLYDEEGEDAPTLLHPSARRPPVGTDAPGSSEGTTELLDEADLRSDHGSTNLPAATPVLADAQVEAAPTAPPPAAPSRRPATPIPYIPGRLDFLMRPTTRFDPLPWMLAAAALVGFAILTFGVLRALGKL